MANMTITKSEVLVNTPEQFELLTMEEVTEVAVAISTLALTDKKKADELTKKFTKLLALRKEVAPKEEIKEIVAVENSIKTPVKTTKKVSPKAKTNAVEKAQAILDSQRDEEEGMLSEVAEAIETASYKELKAMAVEYNVKVPTVIKTEKLREILMENIVGTTPEPKAEEPKAKAKATPKPKATPKVEAKVESPFPETDALGNVQVKFADLSKSVQANPYKVVAYVQEKGQAELTPFTVLFSNSEIVVLLDSVIVKNSVITCDKTHFSKNGTILSLDDNLCPVAFYAPKK